MCAGSFLCLAVRRYRALGLLDTPVTRCYTRLTMPQYRIKRPPKALRRPGVRLDNVALVPASLLPYKMAGRGQWPTARIGAAVRDDECPPEEGSREGLCPSDAYDRRTSRQRRIQTWLFTTWRSSATMQTP